MTEKRSKFLHEDNRDECAINEIPLDVLGLLLQPFQRTEESLFISLVCKLWCSLVKHKKSILPNDIVTYYARTGTLSSLQLIRKFLNNDNLFFISSLFAHAPLHIVDWALSESQQTYQIEAVSGFSYTGRLEYIQTLHNQHRLKDSSSSYLLSAIDGNQLKVVKWLNENGYWTNITERMKTKTTFNLAKCGNIEMLKYLVDNSFGVSKHATLAAAFGGHVEILKYLKELNCPIYSLCCTNAASEGHFEVLKWLRKNGANWTESTCASAAGGGHLEILQWLRDNECPWDSMTINEASKAGHLHIVKWAFENGCPVLSSDTAAENGDLEILKYLKSVNINCSRYGVNSASAKGHLHVLKWLNENGHQWEIETLVAAAQTGMLHVLKWFKEIEHEFDEAILLDVSVDKLRW